MSHVPVLLHESIDGLDIQAGDTFVDATLGAGGHSSEVARRYGKTVSIVGFDLDGGAISLAKEAVSKAGGMLTIVQDNFRNMAQHIDGADRILFDIGVSSMEFGKSGRGFTFMHDEPLLMTLSDVITEDTLTAVHIVNSWPEERLADVIYKYGEEPFSRKIAKAIVTARRTARIATSGQLSAVIEGVIRRRGRIHPATKTFQALRIAVNDELGALEEGISAAWQVLRPGGRIAVITFHSLEDRIVKNMFKGFAETGATIITKKPLVPGREEVLANPRSRSAKLRIIKK